MYAGKMPSPVQVTGPSLGIQIAGHLPSSDVMCSGREQQFLPGVRRESPDPVLHLQRQEIFLRPGFTVKRKPGGVLLIIPVYGRYGGVKSIHNVFTAKLTNFRHSRAPAPSLP